MPEGDAVWNTAQALHRALAGQRLVASDFRVPQLATADLTGWTVLESASRGKHLLLRLSGPDDRRLTLHSHLRMDGSWRTSRAGGRWPSQPAHLIRVVLRTADAVAVGYHLHEVALVPTAEESTVVGHLGPDLLGPDWDGTVAVGRLRSTPDRTIGEALLDQRNLAGIGTIYRAETLFLRGVNPFAPAGSVKELDRVVDLAHRLLMANRGRPGPVTTGDTRRGRHFWVYGRGGEPCRRCGTPVERDTQGPPGEDRGIYWCPSCQP